MIAAFFLGVIATASAISALFFFRFWRDSRDTLFLAFGAFFAVEAISRTTLVFFDHPNEGSPSIYAVRLLALLLILAAILKKNYGEHG
jgi:uncharacterized membrane protein HdeD (DUF308 family)